MKGGVADPGHARYLATRHFGSLDGLRCLSIVPVIWHHATPRPLPGLWGKGPAGVDLFFCISGFLITTLLVREKARSGEIAFGAFYARRALRILPLYYVTLLSYVAFALALPRGSAPRGHFLHTLPFYATFTANWFADFGVTHPILFAFAWSLCIEEQFYAFWPWLVRASSVRGAIVIMALLLVGDGLLEHGAASSLGVQTLRIVTSFSAPIGLGSLLALLLHLPAGFRWLHRVLGGFWSAPLALALVLGLLAWPSTPLFAFQASLATLVGACVIRERHALAPLFLARPVKAVGAMSYGLYLLNSSALGAVRHLFPGHATSAAFVFWVGLPPALLLASLSHRYLEAPFLRLRERYPGARLEPHRDAEGSDALGRVG